MIKVIFFSQNSKFRVRNSHFSHRPKQRYARPAPVSGPTDPKRRNRSPSSMFGHSRSLRGFRPPRPPIQEPGFFQNRFLSRKHRAFMRCNKFRFRSGKLSRTREKYGPIRAATHLFPDGRGRFVPAKHRLPGREAGSREGWKNRGQSLSLSRRRHLRRGSAGRRSIPGPKA